MPRKKKVSLPPHVPSTKDMVFDIVQMPSRARKLLGRNARYERLLQYLIDLNYPEIENCHVPSLKEIATDLDIKYDHIRKGIAMIYHDLNLNSDQPTIPFEFNRLLYQFKVKGYRNSIWMEATTVPVTPRVGDNIDLPFFKAYLATTSFYVESVQHEFRDNQQIIYIRLETGHYNLYWHFRKDKAWEEQEIPFHEMIHMDELELKRRLKVGKYL